MKCKECGNKFDSTILITNGINKFCTQKCMKTYTVRKNKELREKNKLKKEKVKQKKQEKRIKRLESIPVLKKKLDTIFSKYIRTRDSLLSTQTLDKCECITCKEIKPFANIDAGHFISRAKMGTRWDPINVHGQCKLCNVILGGEQYKHGLAIDERYGEGVANKLLCQGQEIYKLNSEWMLEQIDRFTNMYNNLIESFDKGK